MPTRPRHRRPTHRLPLLIIAPGTRCRATANASGRPTSMSAVRAGSSTRRRRLSTVRRRLSTVLVDAAISTRSARESATILGTAEAITPQQLTAFTGMPVAAVQAVAVQLAPSSSPPPSASQPPPPNAFAPTNGAGQRADDDTSGLPVYIPLLITVLISSVLFVVGVFGWCWYDHYSNKKKERRRRIDRRQRRAAAARRGVGTARLKTARAPPAAAWWATSMA